MARSSQFVNLESELVRARVKKSELARYIGLSTGSMSSRFRGATEFKLDEMERIRDRLSGATYKELTLDYLFERK